MRTILGRLAVAGVVTAALSTDASAQCTTIKAEGNGSTIDAASANTLQNWQRAARAFHPEAGDWKYSIGLTVTCKVVTSGSGPRRHRRWFCNADGQARKPGATCVF